MLQSDHALFRSDSGHAGLGMVTADPELRLAHCNRAFCAMLGYEHKEISGLRMGDVVSPQDMARIERSTGEREFHGEWQFRRKDGSSFVGAVLGSKLPDGWFQAIVLDINETNGLEAVCSAQENKDRYFSKLEKRLRGAGTARETVSAACEVIGQEPGAAFAGIGELHPDGKESKERQSFLLALNDALRRISDPMEIMATASKLLCSRLAAGQVAYADIDEAGKHAIISREWNDGTIPIKAAVYETENFSALREELKRGQTVVISDVRADRLIPVDTLAGFERASIGALLNVPLVKDDRLVAVLAVHMTTARSWTQEEVTLAQEVAERTWEAVQRACAEQALRESEELLRFSMKGAGAGAWQWDVWAKGLIWSPECCGLHGVDPKLGKPQYEDWVRCVHPDDRESVEKAVFDALMTEAREYRAEYRVVLPSGEVRWLEARGQVDYAAGGQPVRMAGIILDITERKRAEEALRESEEWLRLAVKSSGAAVWQWDILKDEQVWSPESYKLHGRDPKLGPPDYEGWLHCLHPDDRASAEKAAFDAVEKRSPEYRMEYRVLLPSAEVRWLDALGKVDYAADGTPLRMSGINLDITGRKRAEEAPRESEEWLRLALKGSGAAP